MRKLIYSAAAAAALLAPVAAATAASASTGPSTNSGLTKMVGQHPAAYQDPFFGGVSCTEVDHSKNVATPFDSINCSSTTGLPLTNVTPGQIGSVGWNSDFASGPSAGLTGTLNFTVSADGMSYTGIATYGG
jgi:hypothetical protein